MALTLDTLDWRILRELQGDGRMSNVALAERIGLSPPACLRRMRALEVAGLIKGYAVLLDEKALGFGVQAFVLVGLHSQQERDLRAFENRILAWPFVRDAHMLSGDNDYVLSCVAPTLDAFHEFVLRELTAQPNVASVKTHLAIKRVKREPGIPLGGGEA